MVPALSTPARGAGRGSHHAGLVSHARELFERAVSERLGPQTAPTDSSTRSTGAASPWSASACTGCSPKPYPRPRLCTPSRARRVTASAITTWWNYAESRLLDRELGSWHHRAGPEQPPRRNGVGPARRTPTMPVPGHAAAPSFHLRASVAAALRDGHRSVAITVRVSEPTWSGDCGASCDVSH